MAGRKGYTREEIIAIVGDRLVRQGSTWVKTEEANDIIEYVVRNHGVEEVTKRATRSPKFTVLEVKKR